MTKVSVLKEAAFLAILSAVGSIVWSMRGLQPKWLTMLLVGVLVVQLVVHVVMTTTDFRCNPRHGARWCNALALVFGLVYMGAFLPYVWRNGVVHTQALVGLLVGIYIIVSHIVYIPIDNKLTRSVRDACEPVTVVTLNYKRPQNLVRQLESLSTNPRVAEIIVGDNSPTGVDLSNFEKVKVVRGDNSVGGAFRFLIAEHATHDNVLFLDDDVIPSTTLIEDMIGELLKDPRSVVGPIVRNCTPGGYSGAGYSGAGYILGSELLGLPLPYNTTLTPVMMTSKTVLDQVRDDFQRFLPQLRSSKGNGEDLIFNHCFRQRFHKTPTRVRGSYRSLDTESHSYRHAPGHMRHRDQLCRALHAQ